MAATTPPALRLARLVGLSARLARLVTDDTITAPARDALLHRLQFDPAQRAALTADDDVPPPAHPAQARARAWLVDLLSCRWCVAVWTTSAAVAADQAWGRTRAYRLVADTALAAYLVGWVAEHEEVA